MANVSPPGRRDRKKAATRRTIADAAMRLFLERGFADVSVRDVADEADVSTTTLFAYFPSKESLVFDQEQSREQGLLAVVRGLGDAAAISQALRRYFLSWLDGPAFSDPRLPKFVQLVDSSLDLQNYFMQMWTRYETSLSAAIAEELGLPPSDTTCRAFARFTLQIPSLVRSSMDPAAAVEASLHLLEAGWTQVQPVKTGSL